MARKALEEEAPNEFLVLLGSPTLAVAVRLQQAVRLQGFSVSLVERSTTHFTPIRALI